MCLAIVLATTDWHIMLNNSGDDFLLDLFRDSAYAQMVMLDAVLWQRQLP